MNTEATSIDMPKRMPASIPLGKPACALMLFAAIIAWLWLRSAYPPGYEVALDIILLTGSGFLAAKALLSMAYAPAHADDLPENATVSAVVACHNEDPDIMLGLIRSFRMQDYPLKEVIIVDDGSTDERTVRFFDEFADESGLVRVKRFSENQGKIAALYWGIRRASGTHLLLTDADGLIASDAARKLLAPFSDERVGAVCGFIKALNRKQGFLSRMQGLIYDSAYYLGRSAQSVTGSVIVCSGALSMYRADVLSGNLDGLRYHRGSKHPRRTGDDSALTSIVLGQGYRTVYQSDAICQTSVPGTLRAFLKQQTRWTRDAYVTAIEFAPTTPRKPIAMVWHFAECFLWIVMLAALGGVLMTFQLLPTLLTALTIFFYIAAASMVSMAYSVDEDRLAFITCIAFTMFFEVLLFGVRVISLVTAARSTWR